MPDLLSRASLGGSFAALLAATTCCVLPMSLMIAGLGGSWLAVFSPIAALSPYVIGLSVILLIAAWFAALRRGASGRTMSMLAGGSLFSLVAWLIVINDERLTMLLLEYI
ncbi:MAG: hypothetical protein JJ913_10250 [Rhizobiaceae bacterium]|nr:hypothetical protein [Rhizobiaceae bacterium]